MMQKHELQGGFGGGGGDMTHDNPKVRNSTPLYLGIVSLLGSPMSAH